MHEQPRKILVIRFSALGDVVLTTPVFRELKRVYPQAKVWFLTAIEYAELVKHTPHIDHLIGYARKSNLTQWLQLLASLGAEEFDLIYDIHNSLRSRLIRWLLWWQAKVRPRLWVIRKEGWSRWLLIHFKIRFRSQFTSQRTRLLAPLQQAHPDQTLQDPTELFIPLELQQQIQIRLQQNGFLPQKIIAIGASASFPLKCWPLEYYRELVGYLLKNSWKIILVGGKNEVETTALAEFFGDQVLNLSGQCSPLESAALLKCCDFAIANDTSIVHLAEAVGTPVIALFGPTVKEFGYMPFLAQSQTLELDLPCRPCSRNGKGACKIAETQKCLRDIKPAQVVTAIGRI